MDGFVLILDHLFTVVNYLFGILGILVAIQSIPLRKIDPVVASDPVPTSEMFGDVFRESNTGKIISGFESSLRSLEIDPKDTQKLREFHGQYLLSFQNDGDDPGGYKTAFLSRSFFRSSTFAFIFLFILSLVPIFIVFGIVTGQLNEIGGALLNLAKGFSPVALVLLLMWGFSGARLYSPGVVASEFESAKLYSNIFCFGSIESIECRVRKEMNGDVFCEYLFYSGFPFRKHGASLVRIYDEEIELVRDFLHLREYCSVENSKVRYELIWEPVESDRNYNVLVDEFLFGFPRAVRYFAENFRTLKLWLRIRS